MTDHLVSRIKAARRAGAPLILIPTPDQPAVMSRIVEGFAGNGATPPIIGWSPLAGFAALNPPAAPVLAKVEPPGEPGYPQPSADLATALLMAPRFDERTILILPHAGRAIEDGGLRAVAGMLALRDPYKATARTLVLLAPAEALPPELASDVLIFSDPKPDAGELSAMAGTLAGEYREDHTDAPAPDAETLTRAGLSLEGLNRFGAEQSIALSLVEHAGGIVTADLRERRRALVGQVPGLKMDRPVGTRADIGGLGGLMDFLEGIMTGSEAPRAIIRIEEIEKAIGGHGTDTSGTTTDQVGVLLAAMEDEGWTGNLLAGVPGAGKSLVSKTLAAMYDAEALTLDLGAAKGSLVGQSERQIRDAVRTIRALAGPRALFLASCNRMTAIPAELKRRFRLGTWYFDLPTAEERAAIWPIHVKAYGLDSRQPLPNDDGWTGADIRNACELAYRLRRPLIQAARYVLPVSQSDPAYIEQIRGAARGRWFSATTGDAYGADEQAAPAARRFQS